MLSFPKIRGFFYRTRDAHQKWLSQQSPKNFELSLQQMPLKKLEKLYEDIFDMLVKESNEESSEESDQVPAFFYHRGDSILTIRFDSFSSVYNRLLKYHYHYSDDQKLIESEKKKQEFEKYYKCLLGISRSVKYQNTDDNNAIKQKLQKIKNDCEELAEKVIKIKNELESYRMSMIEFLMDAKIALDTSYQENHLVSCFNNLCDEILNNGFDDNSEIRSISPASSFQKPSQKKVLTKKQSFYSNTSSLDNSTIHQCKRVNMMEFY